MKYVIHIIVLSMLLASCSIVYQVNEVQSSNVKLVNSKFVYEDSVFAITYNLWSDGGKMDFYIYNKTDVPIYIDWNKSNLIVQGKSLDDWSDNTTIKTTGSNTTAGSLWRVPYTILNPSTDSYSSASYSTSTSLIIKVKPDNQIPPHSYIERTTFNLQYPFLMPVKRIKNKQQMVTTSDNGFEFRNYIAWTKNEEMTKLKFINNDFNVYRVTSLVNGRIATDDDLAHYCGGPNKFYTIGKWQPANQ